LLPALVLLAVLLAPFFTARTTVLRAQDPLAGDPLKTPLPQEILHLLANEVSGQRAFDNLVKMGGAPWMRSREELTGETNFYESEELLRLTRAYGIETVRLDRYPTEGTFEYPLSGGLWVWEGEGVGSPGRTAEAVGGDGGTGEAVRAGAGTDVSRNPPPEALLVARLPDDPALVVRGSRTSEVTGPLLYVPDVSGDQLDFLETLIAAEPDRYRGAVLLMWSHPRGALFQALDRAGALAVISFNARERYLDPDQVVYARGSYAQGESLRLGLTVSWRQWTQLMEDVQKGRELVVHARARVEEYPDRFETVYAWIPGTEPEAKGVVFTAHLFEGYLKRGTNDNLGGPAIQLEILRALTHLMESGHLPRPRRSMHFIWPQEISGTYEFLRRNPDLVEALAININMDMVSEGLRKNNSVFTMSETPPRLASFYDGLAHDVLSYVWRTNDIVYLPDSPRGRAGGQYLPRPMVEKNGSRDAFRFFIHEATGGSDHIVFNNPSVGVPGIEFFTWPDQWYHADKDLPENADPTEMRRVAFIGAATAWASANLTDAMLPDLLESVSSFGHARLAERGLPRALAALDQPPGRRASEEALGRALNVVSSAVAREKDALLSVHEVHSGSETARERVAAEVAKWEAFGESLELFVRKAASANRAEPVSRPEPTDAERKHEGVIPRLAPEVKGKVFYLSAWEPANRWFAEHPGVLSELGVSDRAGRAILDWVDGERSVATIRDRVAAWTSYDLTVEQVADYLEILEEVGWIEMERR
jgi:hypothetical protein